MPEPKFKVGDRVTHPDYELVFTIREILILREQKPLLADYRVSYPHSASAIGTKYFNKDQLTLYKEEEMTQKFKIGDKAKGNGYDTIYTIIDYDASRKLYLFQNGNEEHFSNGCDYTLYVEEKPAATTEADRCLTLWKEWHLMKIRNAAYVGKCYEVFNIPNEKVDMMICYFKQNGFTVESKSSDSCITNPTKFTVTW